jgi:hypothetical protein
LGNTLAVVPKIKHRDREQDGNGVTSPAIIPHRYTPKNNNPLMQLPGELLRQ